MDKCCGPIKVQSERFRKAVWIAFAINLSMFAYEFGASFLANSASLKADALDFLGDAANYAVSLFVLSRSLHLKAKASLLKGLTMGGFGIWVFSATVYNAFYGKLPDSEAMVWIGTIALVANLTVAVLLYQFRDGDSNMKSVWLCSRNDAIGNVAVMGAAAAVFYFKTRWPDLVVAFFMAYLTLSSSVHIISAALHELKSPEALVSSPAKPKACSSQQAT